MSTPAAAPPEVVTLDVVSDVVCPWCFIGRRRLQRALAAEPAGAVRVRWRAFQLNPDLPAEGVDERAFFLRKFGSGATMRAAWARVATLGAEEGIAFDFERAGRRAPNTGLAHRAVAVAARRGQADALVEALFSGFFERGADVGRLDVVLDLAAEAGLDRDELAGALARGEGEAELRADLEWAAQAGITGVPCFVADGGVALSGAHEPALLRKLLDAARERRA